MSVTRDRMIFSKPLTCAQCGQTFALDTCLAAHKTIEHLERPPHTCAVCRYAFFSSIAFNDHLVRHSLQRDSPTAYYRCSECGLDFPTEHGMRVHLSTHTGLSIQSRGHNNVKRYNLFQCPLCPTELVGRKLYHEHIRMHKRQKLSQGQQCVPISREETQEELERRQGLEGVGSAAETMGK